MTTEIHVSNVKIADDSDLRSMNVRLGSHTITTPVKSIITKDFYKDTKFPRKLTALNEIFFRFNEKSLFLFYTNSQYSQKINKKAQKTKNFVDCDSLCFTEFRNIGDLAKYPNENEINALLNITCSFSDIVLIPSIPKIARSITMDNFNDFMAYLSKCYEKIQIKNKGRRILGYVPTVSNYFVDDLIDFYIDRGINGYYIDFDGTMVTSHLTMIEGIKTKLAQRGYYENSFLYYINVSYGKAINEQNTLSARDMLAFGHGLDCLGGVHTGPKRNKAFFEWMKEHRNLENAVRLFNKQDYGYYRINSPDIKIDEIFPSDSLYPIGEMQDVGKSRLKRLTSIINLHQQSMESENLQYLVNENPNKTIDYFDAKEMISKDDIKHLIKKR